MRRWHVADTTMNKVRQLMCVNGHVSKIFTYRVFSQKHTKYVKSNGDHSTHHVYAHGFKLDHALLSMGMGGM